MTEDVTPIKIFKTPDAKLGIEWNNGKREAFALKALRLACPCALCVDENTGERLISESSIQKDLSLLKVSSVGRYALSLEWSDGHKFGIYPYSLLSQLTKSE